MANTFKDSGNKSKIYKYFLILIVLILSSFLAALIAGVFMAIGGNIGTVDFTVAFDSSLTIAYLLLYYFLSSFYQLSRRQNYLYLLLAISLSFTTDFVQGSILLIVLPPILRKFRLI